MSTQQPEDLGAGHVLVVLDHGTGAARLSYENLTDEQMISLGRMVTGVGESRKAEREREEMREQIRRELTEETDKEESESG